MIFILINILELVTKEKNKHCRERKKGISEFASSKIELTGHNDVTFWVSNKGVLMAIKFSSQ